MSNGTLRGRAGQQQEQLFYASEQGEAPGHPFYQRFNAVLEQAGMPSPLCGKPWNGWWTPALGCAPRVEEGLAAADRGELVDCEEVGKLIDSRCPG